MNKGNKREFAIAEIIIVAVIVILLVLMAAPAFRKVRETSQKQAIATNLRLLACLLYTSPSPRDGLLSRMPSSA